MAITTGTTAKNRIKLSVSPKSLIDHAKSVLSSAVSFNQGDLIALDTGTNLLKAVTATTDAANILGIAKVTVASGKIASPYQGTAVDASVAISEIPGPEYGSVVSLKLKSGDAFTPMCKVYLADGQDCQTVSSVDPGDGNSIGIYQGGSVTATSGSEGDILLGSRYGGTSLRF